MHLHELLVKDKQGWRKSEVGAPIGHWLMNQYGSNM